MLHDSAPRLFAERIRSGRYRPIVTPSCDASETQSQCVRCDAIAPRWYSTMTIAVTDARRPVGPIPGISQASFAVVHERDRELVDEAEAIHDP